MALGSGQQHAEINQIGRIVHHVIGSLVDSLSVLKIFWLSDDVIFWSEYCTEESFLSSSQWNVQAGDFLTGPFMRPLRNIPRIWRVGFQQMVLNILRIPLPPLWPPALPPLSDKPLNHEFDAIPCMQDVFSKQLWWQHLEWSCHRKSAPQCSLSWLLCSSRMAPLLLATMFPLASF